jgi:phage tail tape-measure protein
MADVAAPTEWAPAAVTVTAAAAAALSWLMSRSLALAAVVNAGASRGSHSSAIRSAGRRAPAAGSESVISAPAPVLVPAEEEVVESMRLTNVCARCI